MYVILKAEIKQRSLFKYYFLSVITLGIYALFFWSKLAKDINTLCEGDGRKTMKYIPSFILSLATVFVYGFVWKYQLAERMNFNAERYGLKFSESGALVVVCSIPGLFLGHFILIKNFNKMVSEFNKYNGLIEETDEVSIFDDFNEADTTSEKENSVLEIDPDAQTIEIDAE